MRTIMFVIALTMLVLTPVAFYWIGWRGLVATIWTAPIAGIFFLLDSWLLTRWQRRLLTSWSAKWIDFVAFSSALRAQAMLPKDTVEGMISCLPWAPSLAIEQSQTNRLRVGISALVLLNSRYESNRRALRMCSCLLIATGLSMLALSALGNAAVLLILLASFLEIFLRYAMRWQLIHRARKQLAESYREILQDLFRRGQLADPWASILSPKPWVNTVPRTTSL